MHLSAVSYSGPKLQAWMRHIPVPSTSGWANNSQQAKASSLNVSTNKLLWDRGHINLLPY